MMTVYPSRTNIRKALSGCDSIMAAARVLNIAPQTLNNYVLRTNCPHIKLLAKRFLRSKE